MFKSICDTVDVEFEILKIENEIEKVSITRAYNIGATKAKFDYLVFVHEDIVFHSNNWGSKLLDYFRSLESPGVLGVVGSSYLPISPSDWWISDKKNIFSNYISNAKDGKIGTGSPMQSGEQKPKKVYALDGMFLAIKKSTFLEFSFDENIPGFHGYDSDLCFQVSQKFQNYFVPGILIEHFSKGSPDIVWLNNQELAKRKILPKIHDLYFKNKINKKLELKAYHLFLRQLYKYGENKLRNLYLAYFYLRQISSRVFIFELYIIFFKYCFRFLFLSHYKKPYINLTT